MLSTTKILLMLLIWQDRPDEKLAAHQISTISAEAAGLCWPVVIAVRMQPVHEQARCRCPDI